MPVLKCYYNSLPEVDFSSDLVLSNSFCLSRILLFIRFFEKNSVMVKANMGFSIQKLKRNVI